MASTQLLFLSLVVMAASGAPQFGIDSDEQPKPYDFAYGVNVPETGDVKEHKESLSPSGRTEGEYRWLQPNGLYLVVRYFVEGDSGFQADVSEEPGEEVANYYTNSISQESSSGSLTPSFSSSLGSLAKSIDSTQSTLDSTQSTLVGGGGAVVVNAVSAPRPSSRQQGFVSREDFSGLEQGGFGSQRGFSAQRESFGNVIDGGIIDGGIIDGGIIDGGIIDGGIIDGGSIENDSRFQG